MRELLQHRCASFGIQVTLLADFIGLGELLAKFNMGSTRNYRWLVVLMTVPGQGVRAAPRHVTGDCDNKQLRDVKKIGLSLTPAASRRTTSLINK